MKLVMLHKAVETTKVEDLILLKFVILQICINTILNGNIIMVILN
jgi:hypothetical protein